MTALFNFCSTSYESIGRARWRIAELCLTLVTLIANQAGAVVVGTVMDTTVNPADYAPVTGPDWSQGDPGWNNVTQAGSNYVYLGDNWVLSARHVGVSNPTFSTGTFTQVQNVTVHNPPPSLANGVSLTAETDLRLIRVSGNVGLPSLTIASESPPLTGSNGSEVVFIGRGPVRAANETHWLIPNLSNPPSNWAQHEVSVGGNVHGYKTSDPPREKRWGTNRLENPSSGMFNANAFDEILSSTTAVMPLTTANGQTRDVISMVTVFNQQAQSGATPWEAQAVSGDSGSAVFYNRGSAESPDWVLAGIVNATLIYGNQPRAYAVYGNATTFADLSYYNQPYKSSICDIMKSCGSYSMMGDVNIDGVVTGDGTGTPENDDVAAFVSGWGIDNLAGKGDYDSWTRGDLNLDGKTDVQDFLLLRGALNEPIAIQAMQAMFGVVPEPSSAILGMLAAAFLGIFGRRSARR